MAATRTASLPRALQDFEVKEDQIITELGVKQAPRKMLDVHKNPLLISILDGVDTLKAMHEKSVIPPLYLRESKGLLIMKTDKVGARRTAKCTALSASCADPS